MESSTSRWNAAFWCILYGAGIVSTLVVYGVLQERIMTIPFGGELFTVSAFLVLCNRVCNLLFAGVMIMVYRESFRHKAPLWNYVVISFSNVAATTCQYESLKYVSFPVQILGKSFKMMPVMVWGIMIANKKHSAVDWFVAGCVTFGVMEFLMTGPTSSPNDTQNSMKGFILLLCFLACDGLTSTFQEKLFKEYNTSTFNQMFYVNVFSALVSLFSVLLTGELNYCLNFTASHSDFVANAGLLSAAATSSQYFIYSQVKEYGALVFAATMNVRQVSSILVSYATYSHGITRLQMCGLMTIFGALFYKSYTALVEPKRSPQKALETDALMKKPQREGSGSQASV